MAALSKQFLRELPQPLLTNEWVEAFASVERVPERKQQLQALNLLIILLPNVHRDSLKRLLMFLNKVGPDGLRLSACACVVNCVCAVNCLL